MNKAKLSEFHKSAILCAANELFCQFGVENTTMNMVAKLASYSTATVYSYFSGKDEIFFTLVLGEMEVIKSDIDKIVASEGNYEAKYYAVCNRLVDYQRDKPLYFEAMTGHINMNFAASDTPEVYRRIFETGNSINESLGKLLDEGIAAGAVDPGLNREVAIFYMWGCILGTIRTASQKNDYFMLNNVEKKKLLEFSFRRLLFSLSKSEVKA